METLQDALDVVDGILATYTFDAYNNVVAANSGVISTLLVLYVAFLGFGIWRGSIQIRLIDAGIHVLKVTIATWVATQWAFFSEWVYTLAISGSDDVIGALLAPLHAGGGSPESVTSRLGTVLEAIRLAFSAISLDSSIFSFGEHAFAWATYVILIILGGVVTFLILVTKIFLAVLLVLAPVFVPMLLFKVTRGIFEGWLKALITFMILPLLLYTVMAVFISVLNQQVATMAEADGLSFSIALPILIVMFGAIIAFFSVAPIASTIGGGASVSALSVLGTAYGAYATGRFIGGTTARSLRSGLWTTPRGIRSGYRTLTGKSKAGSSDGASTADAARLPAASGNPGPKQT